MGLPFIATGPTMGPPRCRDKAGKPLVPVVIRPFVGAMMTLAGGRKWRVKTHQQIGPGRISDDDRVVFGAAADQNAPMISPESP